MVPGFRGPGMSSSRQGSRAFLIRVLDLGSNTSTPLKHGITDSTCWAGWYRLLLVVVLCWWCWCWFHALLISIGDF